MDIKIPVGKIPSSTLLCRIKRYVQIVVVDIGCVFFDAGFITTCFAFLGT